MIFLSVLGLNCTLHENSVVSFTSGRENVLFTIEEIYCKEVGLFLIFSILYSFPNPSHFQNNFWLYSRKTLVFILFELEFIAADLVEKTVQEVRKDYTVSPSASATVRLRISLNKNQDRN